MAVLFFLVFHWVVLTRALRICNQCRDVPAFSTMYLLLSLRDYCPVLLRQINHFWVLSWVEIHWPAIIRSIYALFIWCREKCLMEDEYMYTHYDPYMFVVACIHIHTYIHNIIFMCTTDSWKPGKYHHNHQSARFCLVTLKCVGKLCHQRFR